MRLWTSALLLLFVSLGTCDEYDYVEEADDDDYEYTDKEKEPYPYCGGVTDVSEELSVSPPTAKFPDADPSTYQPFRFLFLPMGDWTATELNILKKIVNDVNNRISPMIRGPRLKEVRLARKLGENNTCRPPRCASAKNVPSKYALPCIDEDGNVVKDGSEAYAQEVQEYNKEQYSVVAYVVSPTINNKTHKQCRNDPPVAFAEMCQRGERNRPTHGCLVICQNLAKVSEHTLQDTVLHESLHIVLQHLDGSDFPSNPAVQQGETDLNILKQKAEGITWKRISRNWEADESLSTRTTVNITMTITPNVVKYVKEHFNCNAVEGAELAIDSDGSASLGHWNFRLFPDEVLTPLNTAQLRLSKLTLAYILDSTWYDVNFSNAEPLTVSRPRVNGCEVAGRSCFKVLNESRSAGRNKVYLGHPYCDIWARMVSPLCSTDNQVRLACANFLNYTHNCAVRFSVMPEEAGYGHPTCHLSKAVPERLKEKGLRAGNGTMCITFVDTNWTRPSAKKRKLYAGCLTYECRSGQLILKFQRENKPSCDVTIKAGVDDNKIIKDPFPDGDECASMLSPMRFIAPEVRTMCPLDDPKSALWTTTDNSNAACDWHPSTWCHLTILVSSYFI